MGHLSLRFLLSVIWRECDEQRDTVACQRCRTINKFTTDHNTDKYRRQAVVSFLHVLLISFSSASTRWEVDYGLRGSRNLWYVIILLLFLVRCKLSQLVTDGFPLLSWLIELTLFQTYEGLGWLQLCPCFLGQQLCHRKSVCNWNNNFIAQFQLSTSVKVLWKSVNI